MQVKELMSRALVTVGPAESCLDAVVRMQRARVRHLPVVNRDGDLVGIITDRDLRHHLFSPQVFGALSSSPVDQLLGSARVAEVMSTGVLTVDLEASLAEAAATMRAQRVGSLPVVEKGHIAGIITEIDVLRQILRADAACAPECAEIIVSYP